MKTSSTYACLLAAALGLSAMPGMAEQSSGFLQDYPTLTPVADVPGASRWEKPGFKRGDYDRVIIAPITIFIAEDSPYKGLDADQLKSLSDGLKSALTDALEPDIAVVDKPSKGTLAVRLAITKVKLNEKERGLLGYTPIGFVVTSAQQAAGHGVELVDAGIEGELLDAVSGERLVVVVDNAPLAGEDGEKEDSWSAIQARLKIYAERFRQRMDEAGAR